MWVLCHPHSLCKFQQDQRVGAQKRNLKNATSLDEQVWANRTAKERNPHRHSWKNKDRNYSRLTAEHHRQSKKPFMFRIQNMAKT